MSPVDSWMPRVVPGEFFPSAKQVELLLSRVGTGGHTYHLLRRIAAEHQRRTNAWLPEDWSPAWLVPYRAELRQAITNPKPAETMLFLTECSREMIPLGVWLLGKCADRFRLHNLRYFCGDESPKVRKHVAQALRRLEAWHLLNAMANAFPLDAQLQRTAYVAANPVTKRPFRERLKDFSRNIDDSHAAEAVGPSRMTYWSRFTPWQGQPPKSLAFIRSILLHIRSLLRGNGAAH